MSEDKIARRPANSSDMLCSECGVPMIGIMMASYPNLPRDKHDVCGGKSNYSKKGVSIV